MSIFLTKVNKYFYYDFCLTNIIEMIKFYNVEEEANLDSREQGKSRHSSSFTRKS